MRDDVATTTPTHTSDDKCTSGITAIRCTSGARRRRSMASVTSEFIGSASHVSTGARLALFIAASVRHSGYEVQFRRPLSGDRHGDLGTKTRRFAPQSGHQVRHQKTVLGRYVHQQPAAIRRRRHFFNEQAGETLAGKG